MPGGEPGGGRSPGEGAGTEELGGRREESRGGGGDRGAGAGESAEKMD